MSSAAPVRLVVVTGPTASGKTAASVALAQRLGAEIVSADSMQVYRGLDIGTAKPSLEERGGVPHHLIDVVDVDEPYHAGRFVADARAAIAQIHARGRPCVVAGGTALYLKALLGGLMEAPGRDEALRAELDARWEAGEAPALWDELSRADPATSARLHPNDRSRILRALELWRLTGVAPSELRARHGFSGGEFAARILGMRVERDELARRIAERTRRMLEAGWAREVEGLLSRGVSPSLPPLEAIGYRQIRDFLAAGGDPQALEQDIVLATRRFAKRQMTWFRKMDVAWFDPGDVEGMLREAKYYLHPADHEI